MNTLIARASMLAAVLLVSSSLVFAQITPGNVVVVRIGDGASALSNAATAVFLDEYSPGGALVQSLPMPTAVSGANLRFTNSGSATSEGILNLSANGQYLVLAGYDAALGLASVASSSTASVLRVIARVDLNGNVDTTTSVNTYSANNVRSVASVTGNEFWVGGPGNGVSYVANLGATSGTQLATNLANVRVVQVSTGQLYCSSASGAFQGVSTVGSGTPTTAGQTISLLPGFPVTSGPGAYDFWFADPSTCYVADDRVSPNGGIQKWSLIAGTWTLQYTLNVTGTGCRGLTGSFVGGAPVLYATTSLGSLNQLVTVTDTGAGAPFSVVATAATGTIFRGVRFIRPPTNVTTVGVGCAGGAAQAPVLSTSQSPYLGNVGFSIDVTQAIASAPVFVFASIGTNPAGIPIDGSCSIYLDLVSLDYLLSIGISPIGPVTTDLSGAASLPLPIPALWAFAGTPLGLQAAVVDGASSIGVDLTNAIELTLN